jgi:hypothetical protein
MKRSAPYVLLVIGLLTMFVAFLYSAGNALPYPDPTPELLAHQAAVARKWNIVVVFGLIVSAVGAIWLWRRRYCQHICGVPHAGNVD